MRVLLDTHSFLWWVTDDPRLSARAREIMSDGENHLFFSAASAWEVAIKARLGRLTIPEPIATFVSAQLAENAIEGLPINLSHALQVHSLPDHHRDPFDRMLVAQSQLENLPILTGDPLIEQYPVEILWRSIEMGDMQMDVLEALMTRRSVRAYTDEPVSDDQVRKILAAGMQAPSANNRQPWHFVVLRRRERLDGLAEVLPFGKMLGHAPLGIVVCADVGNEQNASYWVQDCAAATQNILLACHALGLGAVWIGVYPRDERVVAVRKILSLPETVTPLCAIAIGRPVEHPAPVDRFRSDRIHDEQW